METEVAFYGDSRGGARGTELQLGFLFLHRRGSSKPKTDIVPPHLKDCIPHPDCTAHEHNIIAWL